MFKGKTIVGIITAKAYSKRLPGKNTKLFNGKPLISWTFEAVKQSHLLDRVILTTDSTEIIQLAHEQHVEVPFKRPKYLSTDLSTSEQTVIHALNWLIKKDNTHYDYAMVLQPTSPFRTSVHIDESIERIIANRKADALVSVSDFSRKISWLKSINVEGYLTSEKSQHINPTYIPNGAIYIIKSDILLQLKTMYPLKTLPYVMDENFSIDIDTEEDFQKASNIGTYLYEK